MRNLTFKAAMLNDSRTTVNRQSTDGQSQRHYKQTPLSKRWKVLMTLVFLFTFAIGNVWAAVGDAEVVSLTSGNITANYAKAYAVTTDNDVLADAAIYATSRSGLTANATNGIEPNYMGFLFKPVVNCKVVLKGVNTTTSTRNFSNKVYEVVNTDMYPLVKASSSSNGSISKYLLDHYTSYTTKTQAEWKDLKMIKKSGSNYLEDATNAAKTVTGEAAQTALYTQITDIQVISITKRESSSAADVVESKTFATEDGEYVFQAGKTYAIYLHRNNSGLYVKELSFVPVYQLTWDLDGGTITSAEDAYSNAGYYAKGTTLTAPTVEKTGADFTGWSPTVSTMPAVATTYKATWETACTAGVPGNVTKGALSADKITLTAEGSAADGDTWYWQTSEDGVDKSNSGSTYQASAAGTYYVRSFNSTANCWNVTAKSITLSADDFKAKYAITYDKGASGTGEIAAGEKTEGVDFTLSSDMFTRNNYLQVGWTKTDGTSREYMMGGKYTTDAAQKFYPAWAEKDTYVAAFHYDSENPTTPPAGWTFANAGTYTNTSATVAYVGKFTAEGETTASGKGMDPNHIAFAKNADADAVYDLGYVTTVSAVAGTLMIGSTSAKVASIDYLAADGSTVLHSFNITHNKADWGANNFNETEVVPNVRYIRINGKDFWQVLGAFSVTYGSLVPKYDLAFAKNGGSGADMTTLRYAEDAVVTLPGCTFTAPTNKTFDAWVVTKTASSNPITVTDGKFTMPAEAVTATATWKFLPKLTLTAGEGATGDDVEAYYAATTSIPVPAKPEGFSNGTKEFTGWVYSSDVEITDGAFPMPSTDLTLTAQWASATDVAQILGGDSYETFAEAIAAVAAGQTIQLLADCSYDAAWNLTVAGTVTLDLNGHDLTYNGAGRGVQVHNGAKLILEDGTATTAPTIDLTADPLSRSAITYTSGTFDSKDGMAAINGGEIEINSGRYLATEGVILVKGNGATATVNDGVLISRDNGVLMGNGTNSADFRNYVINVHGGILLGEIVSTGYASMVIYHPNVGELNIDGGTLVSTNGPAVVCRGGESNITGGTIIAQGSGAGWCGDAKWNVPAVGVAYDFKSAYPGVSSFDAKISGDANVSGEAGAVQGIYAGTTPTTAEEDAVAISGGTFNSPVAQALCAENYAPKDNGDGTYGVKPLATSIDFEGYYVDGSHGTVAEALAAHNYTLTADMSDSKKVAWDNNSNAYDKGLKIKEDAKTFSFDVAADKLVAFKTGIISGATLSVNGGAAEVLTITDKSDASIKTRYYYSENAQSFVFTTTTASYNIIKSVTIEDPYVVTYNATDGECATASAMYIGEALTLPTPTHATYSFKGWYDAATDGNLIGAAGAEYTPTASVTLYAQWEAISTVNTLSDLKVDGATIDGFDPATNIYNLVYEYGQQPVITSATATSSVATVTINNTPVDAGTYKYVQVKVVPESGEADQKFYQVRYTNKLKRGVEIIKATVSGGDQSTGFEATGYYGGTGYAKLADNKKMNTNNYVGVKLAAGKTFSTGDVLFVATVSPSTSGGSQIEIYAESAGTNLIWNTGEIDLTNGIALPAEFDGLDEFYIVRKASEGSQAWNGFVNYVSVERYMAPFIEEFKIGEAIGTIDKVNKTIAVEVPATADLEHLTPTIKAYANGGATLDKTGEQDFSSPVDYTVSSAYAEDGDVTYTVTVTKAAAIDRVEISGTLSVLEGETTTLSAAVYDTNDELASIQAVVWTVKSGDEDYAEVDANGVVTGKAIGSAHIIATSVADDTKSAQVEVTVSENPCRVWNAPATSWSDAIVTIGKFQIKRGDCPASSSVTPYSGASSVYGIKVDGNAKFIELTMSDGSQFESLTLGVTSGSNGSSPKYALVASSAVTFNTSSVLSVAEYAANAKDAAQALNDIDLPTGTRNVRIYRIYEGKGDGTSVYLYYANACKKELVPLTSISVADMSLAVGVAGTPVVTLNPTTADVASYVWSIESDETGVATIDDATGVLSSAVAGAVTVKVTATDAFSNVRESNVATINIVNKYVDVVPVSETTTWSWSGKATADVIITGVDTVLANYFGGAEWLKIAGKAANDQYAYRSSSYDCYQGTYLYLNATVPGMLVINTRYASSGAKLSVNGHEIAPLTDQYTEYKVAVPAGNVKIEAPGNQKMRIKTMKFDTDFSKYAVTNNRFNGYTRDVTEGRYGTICLPNGGVMVGATLYEVAYYGQTSKKIFFDEILNGTMEAGVPYIFLPKEGASQLAVYYTDEANESAKNANGLHGFIGANADAEMNVPVGAYILNANQYREVVTLGTAKIKSNRSYIVLEDINPSEPALAPGRRRISMAVNGEQVATGIENTGFESEAPRKVLINGELYIIRGEKMYDAKGQLVK
ncbi:MAG: InlB B-repeat-containing protein [Paludibacteraceae bacterium]|nr:InlB B-repeat-containing protein [Paludibacteraceae bacterium]